MAMARMRRACLASAVRAASARNCEILRSWRVISIADMMPAPRIIDVLHRVTFADGWESHRSQVLRRLVLHDASRRQNVGARASCGAPLGGCFQACYRSTTTLVPTFTRSARSTTSRFVILMQPDDTAAPMV